MKTFPRGTKHGPMNARLHRTGHESLTLTPWLQFAPKVCEMNRSPGQACTLHGPATTFASCCCCCCRRIVLLDGTPGLLLSCHPGPSYSMHACVSVFEFLVPIMASWSSATPAIAGPNPCRAGRADVHAYQVTIT